MQFSQRAYSRHSASMPNGQKGEFDAELRLNGAPAVGSPRCSRTGQNRTEKRNRPAASWQLAPDGCDRHAGVLVATSMLARTLRFNNIVGALDKSAREKEISDGQDTQDTGGGESDRAIEDYDLAPRPERGLPCAGEAGESRHSLDWLVAERD